MSDTPETTEEPIVPPKKSMLIPIVVGLNSVALIGVAVMLFLRGPSASASEAKPSGHEAAAEASESKSEGGGEGGGAPATVRMADFVIRLRDPEVDRYARVTFELEVGSDADKTRVTNSLPKLRDAFITYLSDRTMEELRGRDALEQVKKQLTETVTTQVPHLNLRGLYITEFVVQ